LKLSEVTIDPQYKKITVNDSAWIEEKITARKKKYWREDTDDN
jgi:hypothetical protein